MDRNGNVYAQAVAQHDSAVLIVYNKSGDALFNTTYVFDEFDEGVSFGVVPSCGGDFCLDAKLHTAKFQACPANTNMIRKQCK